MSEYFKNYSYSGPTKKRADEKKDWRMRGRRKKRAKFYNNEKLTMVLNLNFCQGEILSSTQEKVTLYVDTPCEVSNYS